MRRSVGISRVKAPRVVFIGHAFTPRCNSYALDAFRETMRSVEDGLNARDSGLSVVFVTELHCEETKMRSALLRLLDETHLGVLDISDNNPNVLFELGHLAARNVPLKILKSRASLAAGYKMPIYVDEADVQLYAHVHELHDVVTRWLRTQMRLLDGESNVGGEGLASQA